MGGDENEGLAYARVRLACGRMIGGADAMLEAYRFGVAEGPHREPWAADYAREAVHVYAESLPPLYQSDIAHLFRDSQVAMAGRLIPSDLAADWAIVTSYLSEAARSIEEWLSSRGPMPRRSGSERTAELRPGVPRVVHFDALAALTTRDGVQRLKLAAAAVRRHFDAGAPPSLAPAEQMVLRRLASGAPIAVVATELGFSERSMYRELSKLWEKLGVSGRAAGVHKATAEGLID
ncbi:MAG: hypothetical protein F4Y05_06065 [Acidimicrobiaceae bacterium]|nr:hypothetical protein [Acidimicrobiaceae bacterium]MYE09154.1 hypothetical protein [Acidimicrobiaceae bacterium]MYH94664.1 hypothetical protein [Acidimicrobiaceae bacterium]